MAPSTHLKTFLMLPNFSVWNWLNCNDKLNDSYFLLQICVAIESNTFEKFLTNFKQMNGVPVGTRNLCRSFYFRTVHEK